MIQFKAQIDNDQGYQRRVEEIMTQLIKVDNPYCRKKGLSSKLLAPKDRSFWPKPTKT